MKKMLLLSAGVLVLIAGGALAMGHGRGHGIKMMENMIASRIEDAADFIDATPQQRQVFDGAKQEIFKALEARAADRKAHAGEVLSLLGADNLDVSRLDALVDQKTDDMRAVGHVIVGQVAKVHDALTPQQRQKLIDHIKKRHARALQYDEQK